MPEDLVLLADDVFTNYFPDAKSKNVLVDASLLLNNDRHSIATDLVRSRGLGDVYKRQVLQLMSGRHQRRYSTNW